MFGIIQFSINITTVLYSIVHIYVESVVTANNLMIYVQKFVEN